MRPKNKRPSIYDYTDFRKYLKDWYHEKKQGDKNFTYRHISEQVGFKSPGHFTQILQGKANISIRLIDRFTGFLDLRKKESDYFQAMVLFNQSRTHRDKMHYFDKMRSFNESKIRILESRQYKFYDKWYYSAILELLDFFLYKDEKQAGEIGRLLIPSIPSREVIRSITVLEKLELIKKDEDGYYRKTTAAITSGYEKNSLGLNNHYLNTLKLAASALDTFHRSERNLSWLTLSMDQESYEMVREEIRSFRRRILQIATQAPKANRVYQCNFQIFPLSRTHEENQ